MTEWTVTEWTESKNWTESTETYEASEVHRRNSFQRSQQGERLAAIAHRNGLGGGLAASYVAASLNWPIVIWYGEEPAE